MKSTKPPQNGIQKSYYADGTLATVAAFRNGKKHGVCKWYFKNGKVRAEGKFKDGKFTGFWKWYRIEGDYSKPESLFMDSKMDRGNGTIGAKSYWIAESGGGAEKLGYGKHSI